jgi:tRNA dimethylallyltransferase
VRRRHPLVAILGPTAVGKSALAIALAQRLDGEIVSCDSTAVYRGFDIGTDKVPLSEQRGFPHHMIDLVDPTEEYSAARYAREAAAVIRGITSRGKLPILVGGTGLYYRALTRGFPGPGRDTAARASRAVAARRGPGFTALQRVDPPAASRLHAPDRLRHPRAGGVSPDRTAATEHSRPPCRRCRTTGDRHRSEDSRGLTGAWRRVDAQFDGGLLDGSAAASIRRPGRPSVHRSGLPAGARAPARRQRRTGDASAHRPGEPEIRTAAVDLVHERA